MRFVFRLEPVLRDRDRTEKARLREWSIVNQILGNLVLEKKRLENALGEAQQDFNALSATPRISVALLQEADQYIKSLFQKIEWKRLEILRAEKFVQKKHQEWQAARMKKQVIEKIRERRFEDFKLEQKDREAKSLDDLYIMAEARRMRESEEE